MASKSKSSFFYNRYETRFSNRPILFKKKFFVIQNPFLRFKLFFLKKSQSVFSSMQIRKCYILKIKFVHGDKQNNR